MAEGQPAAVDRESFDQLRREHRRLREEFDRLLHCLGSEKKTPAGAAAKFFKGKFEAARRRRPLGPSRARLPNILQRGLLSLVQKFCGGREELLSLREVSRSSGTCTDAIFTGYKLYVLGGFDQTGFGSDVPRSAECLTVSDGTWEVMDPLPENFFYCAGAVMDRYFYTYGALDEGAKVTRFSLKTKHWEVIASMNKRRSAPGAAVVGGRFYVCGGEDIRQRECHSSVEWLDLSVPPNKAGVQGAWRLLPVAMSAMRRHCVAAAIPGQDGKEELFVCGGFHKPMLMGIPGAYNAENAALDSADIIEVHRECGSRRRSAPPMPKPRGSHAGASLGGKVYMCGGYDGSSLLGLATVDCYDPVLEVWSSSAPMPQPRVQSAAVVMAGCLYILGGKYAKSDNDHDPICYPRSVYYLNPATGEWEAAPWELVHGRERFSAVAEWTGAVRTGDLAA
mmetsp:Transcript_17214/g.49154  ORF Transcript_17214/g.49154 Transcript_17214/m.49154 type:complete len:450 (+) Transcript_17214:81-1430(+)